MATIETKHKTIKSTAVSYVKEGKESLKPSPDDLFDKIINLRFDRSSGRGFIIRSDYEPVFHKDNTISFQRCTQKPDIKVSYKQVAESVAIEVDIHITNFFIGDEKTDGDKNVSLDAADGDPVTMCTIQMGYRGQFYDWGKNPENADINSYYDLSDRSLVKDDPYKRCNEISVQILTGYAQSYPPDKVTYFKGIVGSLVTGLPWKQTKGVLEADYGDGQIPKDISDIEKVFYQFVTRRFINPGISHAARDGKLYIYKKSFYKDRDYSRVPDPVKKPSMSRKELSEQDSWEELELLDNNLMSRDDANKFGVICAVSKTLRDLIPETIDVYGLPEGRDWGVPVTPYNRLLNTLGGQIISIEQHYPFIRHLILMDGSYYFYHAADEDKDLFKDEYVKANQKNSSLILPAIYDMTPQGTRTIRCPFISFISPMTTVFFQSRFTISSFVGYFYAPKTNAFLVIISNVSFATVQEDNMMELTCVDAPKKEIWFDQNTGELKFMEEGAAEETPPAKKQALRNMTWTEPKEKQPSRNMVWTERIITVKAGMTSWSHIENHVRMSYRPNRWDKGVKLTTKMIMEAIQDWNKDNPDYKEAMKRGASPENNSASAYKNTGVVVHRLAMGDRILVRYPFQSEYPEDQEVSRNKAWKQEIITVKAGMTRFRSIVEHVKRSFRPDRWDNGAELKRNTVMLTKMVAEAIQDWNKDNPGYKEAMKRGASPENDSSGSFEHTGVVAPILEQGDRILVRYPFQSEYPEDCRVK